MDTNQELKYIFANINEWLKFAEAKHGGLIILNSGMVIGILSSYGNIQPYIYKSTLLISIICFGISVFLSLLSQLPVLQNIFYNKKKIPNANLYFFGHLSHFDNEMFIDELKSIDPTYTANRLDNALMNQILVNARITQAKFLFFRYGTYLTTFGLGLLGVSSIIRILWHF